jgi:hypothetical protein
MDNQIRELLREVADEIPEYRDLPPRFESRARRRVVYTLGATVVIAGVLVLGTVVGVSSLLRPRVQEPARPGLPITTPSPVSPQPSSERRHSFDQGWSLTYRLPDGWRVESVGDELNLLPGAEPRDRPESLIVVGSDPLSVSSACSIAGETSTAQSFGQQIVGNPDLQTSDVVPIAVGGLDGLLLEAEAASDEAISLEDSGCLGVVPVIAVREYGEGRHVYGPSNRNRIRVYLLDVPSDRSGREGPGTLVVIVQAPKEAFERVLAEATPVIESFAFDVG